MKIKVKVFIKLGLIIFIGCAVYFGHRSLFEQTPSMIKAAISTQEVTDLEKASADIEEIKLKFSTIDNGFIGNSVSWVLNKILDNPHGRLIVKDVLQKMVRQSKEMSGHDLFLSRYLVNDILLGSGKSVLCGDVVEVSYKIVQKDSSGNKEEALKTIIKIGAGKIGINFENGIIGMQQGGERQIIYPSSLSAQREIEPSAAIVKLLAIKGTGDDNVVLGKPFFDKLNDGDSSSTKLICGDIVKGRYSLTDLKGNTLYGSEKSGKDFSFKIGEDDIPLELSNAIIGLPMQNASVHFVTSQGAVMQSFGKLKNFIPSASALQGKSDPAILTFQFALKEKS